MADKTARDVLDQQIRADVLPEDTTKWDSELVETAWLIVHHPKLRAEYFAGPEVLLEEYLPAGRGPGHYGGLIRRSERLLRRIRQLREIRFGGSKERRKLALLIELLINDDPRLISAKETFHERESFLNQGVQDPEKTFGVVADMSKTTFNVGLGLVFVGVAFAFVAVFADIFADPDTPERVSAGALAAFFGGSGVVTTLLAVFRASTKELRTITSDMAKIHMILTGYGAETTNLRAAKNKQDVREAGKRNKEFRESTKNAVSLLPSDQPRAGDNGGEEATEQDDAASS